MPQKHKIRYTGSNTPQSCGGKRCYRSRQETELVKTEQEIINPDLTLAIYHCVQCGQWHLTRQTTTEMPQ